MSPNTMPTREAIAAEARPCDSARIAQRSWAVVPLRERLGVLRKVRALAANCAEELAESSGRTRGRPSAEVLTAEVLPWLDAIRFLEDNAERLLAPKRLGSRHRPLWLSRVSTSIYREPVGVTLIIAPGNYPLLLGGVQTVQALAAGNAVLFKPAAGCSAVANRLSELFGAAGLPENLFVVLGESVQEAESAIEQKVDKIILTGSAKTGHAVLRRAAETLTPVVAELSGCDAVLIRDDADLDLAARALHFGLELNSSATCIAPRRVFVARRIAERFEARLAQDLASRPTFPAKPEVAARLLPLIEDALAGGATLLSSMSDSVAVTLPVVIAGARTDAALLWEEVFAPVLTLVVFDNDDEAIELINRCPYALGATVFSRDLKAALSLASRIQAGVVSINDMIAPTADPRVPFGGRRRSGFGVTRGAEGLLEMTAVKVVTETSGTSRPHFQTPKPDQAQLFAGYIRAAHANRLVDRWAGLTRLWNAALRLRKKDSSS